MSGRIVSPHGLACTVAIIGIALGLTACTGSSAVPGNPVPTLDVASNQLQSGNFAGAARALEQIVREDSQSAGAWRALGSAYQHLHKFDEALAAYRHALDVEPGAPQVCFAIGAAYAGKREIDHALEWLTRAHDTRRYDMTEMTVDADLASLLKDPRFSGLLPKAADFDHPFVESVKIVREWRGEASEDQFGWIARNIGDVDGDGVPDIVTSAPTHGTASSNAGRIYVYSTASGKLLWTKDGAPGDQLGIGVEGAGDTNGDGVPDVVASGPAGSGVAYIYSGRDGRILQRFKSTNTAETFGSHISGAGDMNHDGFSDVIVGAPGREGESKIAGHAYLYSGQDGRLLRTFEGERIGDEFGSTVAGLSNGKEQYVIVGAPRAGPERHGRAYVYDSSSGALKFTIEADASGNALGAMFVSAPGDMNDDGVSEVYVSDWSNTAKGRSTGRIYIHSGRTGERLLTLTGESAGDGFGTSPANAGDVDGDGRADLIVGAWQYGKEAVSGGRTYLYSGRNGALLKTYTSRLPGETLGFDAVGMGDVDADGTVDFLITSAWSAVHGHHSGRVFIISSGVRPAS
ncbi:MAG: repeat-containing protein [Gammaproteobacteria bacterium]|nr:repeat-containing protein [Gammaproteobacteria bacterium]